MSRWAKICWLIAGVSLVGVLAARYILGGWIDILWFPFGLFAVCFVAALSLDFKFYLEFFTMKTTKHGMNMGVLIIMVLASLVATNFFAVKYNKTLDMTEEGLNSLSEQSLTLLKNLDKDLNVLVFYRGEKDRDKKTQVKNTLDKYKENSSRIKLKYVNAYAETALAQKYLSRGDQFTVFVETDLRKIKVEEPLQEEQFTVAMLKSNQKDSKKIYFLKGHGERSLESSEENGIQDFKKALEDSSFELSDLSLITGEKIPADAAVIAIVGPQTQIMSGEITELMDFAKKGGRLFIAVDPGQRHNIGDLVSQLGVNFKNNYVLNDRVRLMGQGLGGALGLLYDSNHEITKKFKSGENFSLFSMASELEKTAQAPEGFTIVDLVRTPPSSFVANNLNVKKIEGGRKMFSLGLAVKGSFKKPQKDEKGKEGAKTDPADEFSAIIFGDSDFLSNNYLVQGVNRDLALNSIAYLAKETDLISIRPKKPKGTQLTLTKSSQNSIVLAGVAVPIIFFVLSGVFWFRRRNA